MSIMEEIYYGRVFPAEQIVPKNDKYWSEHRKADKRIEELKGELSKEDYTKLEEICNSLTECQGIICIESYRYGFAMGLLLMREAAENPYMQKDE